MTAVAVADRMTAEGFLALPEQDVRWTELLGGELVDVPVIRDQLICSEVLFERTGRARAAPERGLAPVGSAACCKRCGLPQPRPVEAAAGEVPACRRSRADAPRFDVALRRSRDDASPARLLPALAVALDTRPGE